MDLAAIQAKLSTLDGLVKQLIAEQTPTPVDLQPAGDQIDAISAEVTAALPPASTPAITP